MSWKETLGQHANEPQQRVSQFALPLGLLGYAAGWFMGRGNAEGQREVLEALAVVPGERVFEVGYGSGALVRCLLEETQASFVAGVDPSPEMCNQARYGVRRYQDGGRIDLRVGATEALPFPEASFDAVVSVNTVVIWPDRQRGLEELHRILTPEGRVWLARHSARSPKRFERKLGLSESELDGIERDLVRIFDDVVRHERGHVVAWSGRRRHQR